jgi:hypothetical protein
LWRRSLVEEEDPLGEHGANYACGGDREKSWRPAWRRRRNLAPDV